jgi:hypothetical protein
MPNSPKHSNCTSGIISIFYFPILLIQYTGKIVNYKSCSNVRNLIARIPSLESCGFGLSSMASISRPVLNISIRFIISASLCLHIMLNCCSFRLSEESGGVDFVSLDFIRFDLLQPLCFNWTRHESLIKLLISPSSLSANPRWVSGFHIFSRHPIHFFPRQRPSS